MKVIALELGYDNVALREAGEKFEMPDDVFEKGTKFWFEPVDPAVKAQVAEEVAKREAAKVAVPAINPAEQLAKYQASLEALQSEIAALRAQQAESAKAALAPADTPPPDKGGGKKS